MPFNPSGSPYKRLRSAVWSSETLAVGVRAVQSQPTSMMLLKPKDEEDEDLHKEYLVPCFPNSSLPPLFVSFVFFFLALFRSVSLLSFPVIGPVPRYCKLRSTKLRATMLMATNLLENLLRHRAAVTWKGWQKMMMALMTT